MKTNLFKSYAILTIAGIFLFSGLMANAKPKGKIEICHKPGQHNQKILNISARGAAGHERHGDYLVTPEVCDGLDSDCDKPRVADNDVDCSDGIACTVDSCSGLLGCDNIPDDSLCDDQDPATSDMCVVSVGGCVNTTIQVCGNGIRETPEQCDDGNSIPNDGCSNDCTLPVCGNGILENTEQCDDGNTISSDGCSAVCALEFCGDNIVQLSEQCDDGNTVPGDGCSATCEFPTSGTITSDINRGGIPTGNDRGVESAAGNLIADAQLWATAANGAEIAFMNPGGIRSDLLFAESAGEGDGVVTLGEALTMQPFDNTLVTFPMTGAQIVSALEDQCQPSGSSRAIRHLGVSDGFTYDLGTTVVGFDCTSITISNVRLQGIPLLPGTTYMVTTNNFLADGGDNFSTFATIDPLTRIDGGVDVDALISYLSAFSPVAPPSTDRVNEL